MRTQPSRPVPTSAFDLDGFVAACRAAVGTPDAVERVHDLVRRAVAAPEDVLRALPGAGAEETVLVGGPDVTVVRVEAAPGSAFPPHDHTMPALVGMLAGEESNTTYRLDGGHLRVVGEGRVAAGDVLRMDADVVHAIANRGSVRSVGLHVYLGDLFGTERSVWDPATGERRPYTDAAYLALADRRPDPGDPVA